MEKSVNWEVKFMIDGVPTMTVGFFKVIIPLFKTQRPYGWMTSDMDDLSDSLNISRITIGRHMSVLKAYKIIRKARNGDWYCPMIIADRL